MNFCKKCGGKLENGICHNCSTEKQTKAFCKKCGGKLEDGICNNCTVQAKQTTLKTPSPKEPMSPKTKKIIIASCIGLTLCIGAFAGFKAFESKRQENYAKEAIVLINDGKFEDAQTIMDKYKKEDASILELKELNNLYLDVKKECENGNFSRLSSLKDSVAKSSHSNAYIEMIASLDTISLKNTALENLKDIDKLLGQGLIPSAKSFITDCKKYDLTEEEKAKVLEATTKIEKAEEEEKKKEDAKKKEEEKNNAKSNFLGRYNILNSDYNDAFYSNMYENVSEAEKVTQLEHIALTWDRLLNDIWSYLQKNMDKSSFEALKKKQIEWVNEKMKIEKGENIWGMSANAFAQQTWSTLGQMNKDRVKFLIDNYL